MSDQRLRELERRFEVTRDVADEAALLAARLRAGALARERLELAAYLGHAAARSALGDAAPAGKHVPMDAWAGAVQADPEGLRTLARCWLRLARVTPPGSAAEGQHAAPILELLERALGEGGEDVHAELSARFGAWNATPLEDQVHIYAAATRAAILLVVPGEPPPSHFFSDLCELQARPQRSPWRASADDVRATIVRWALGASHVGSAQAWVGPRARDGVLAEGRFLASQREAGRITADQLELAAWSGHAPARRALRSPQKRAPSDILTWLDGLAPWGPRVLALAVGAVARHRELERAITSGCPVGPSRDELGTALVSLQVAMVVRPSGESPSAFSLEQVERARRALAAPSLAGLRVRPELATLEQVLAITTEPGRTTLEGARSAVRAMLAAWPVDDEAVASARARDLVAHVALEEPVRRAVVRPPTRG